MPHFTYPMSSDGLAVLGLVGLNHQDTATLAQAGQPIPRPVAIRALLDTANDVTAVAGGVVQQLGLGHIKWAQTQTASGSVQVRVYRVSLSISGPTRAPSPLLHRADLLVTELAVVLPNVDVLIGLDVLRECLLIFDGPGDRFTLAF
jgi:hypothetical protein